MQQRKQLYLFPTTGDGSTHIEVVLYYTKGGMNHFTGKIEDRGMYISVKPITKSENSVSYTAFTGYKEKVRKMGRFVQKVFDNYDVNDWNLYCLIHRVIEDNGIKLTDESLKEVNKLGKL